MSASVHLHNEIQKMTSGRNLLAHVSAWLATSGVLENLHTVQKRGSWMSYDTHLDRVKSSFPYC